MELSVNGGRVAGGSGAHGSPISRASAAVSQLQPRVLSPASPQRAQSYLPPVVLTQKGPWCSLSWVLLEDLYKIIQN